MELMKDYVVTMEIGKVSQRPIIRKKNMSPINIGIPKKWEATSISQKLRGRIGKI